MAKQMNIVNAHDWDFFNQEERPIIIGGPCSAESEEQVFATAKQLKENGVNVFRAGIWKPRTHPNTFEGVGSEGLPWLQRIQKELGMKVSTEVAGARHIEEALKAGVDLFWVGARTSANPFLMQEIADALKGVDIPVLVKNPVNPDIELWLGALERLNQAGLTRLGIILRGFTPFEKMRYRNNPQWQLFIDIRQRYPDMLAICDPSHMAGKREYIAEISQKALDLGFDGLMIESHICPEVAFSDKEQQLTPADMRAMLDSMVVRHSGTSEDESLNDMRMLIDVLDDSLLDILRQRMVVARKIGEYKKSHNIAVLQQGRWDKILEKVVRKADDAGLDRHFIEEVFKAIHQTSIDCQTEIMLRE